jgi:multidrug resistance efflux pump
VKNQTANEVHAPSTCQVIEILVKNGADAAVGQNIMNVRSLTNCTVTASLSSLPSTAAIKPGLAVQMAAKGSPKTFAGVVSAVKDGKATITSTNKPEDLQDGASCYHYPDHRISGQKNPVHYRIVPLPGFLSSLQELPAFTVV